VESALRDFVECFAEPRGDRSATMAAALQYNGLKTAASEHAAKVCLEALSINGILGYLNDTPFSVGRHVRDVLSAPLMIANERIHQTNAALLLIAKEV
jgi:acyl-CoA dehydrogenase